MPTPSSDEVVDSRSLHNSCPPDDDRSNAWRMTEMEVARADDPVAAPMNQQPTPPPSEAQRSPGMSDVEVNEHRMKQTAMAQTDQPLSSELLSPVSVEYTQDEVEQGEPHMSDGGYGGSSSSMSNDFSNVRLIPSSPSSFMRAGSKFRGTQQSERQIYEVQVEIKHVDMRESFLCGYLRIQGLTEDHPTLTTYFEGEIIGTKYSFLTQHEDWGSTDKVDLQHWAKFNAFRPFQKQARKGNLYVQGLAQRENIFMRWKEHFLVPDHRVRTISGASFEGFYYICFNQCQGTVSGIYFHAKSEKFQQLELKHVEDRGCFPALEFRVKDHKGCACPSSCKELYAVIPLDGRVLGQAIVPING